MASVRAVALVRAELRASAMGRVGDETHESADRLYGFLAAVRRGDLYAPRPSSRWSNEPLALIGT
jgi:hypothetical protein